LTTAVARPLVQADTFSEVGDDGTAHAIRHDGDADTGVHGATIGPRQHANLVLLGFARAELAGQTRLFLGKRTGSSSVCASRRSRMRAISRPGRAISSATGPGQDRPASVDRDERQRKE